MRLTLDIPEETHRQIKTLAAFHGLSMKDFILKRTLEPVKGKPAEDEENSLPTSPWRVKPDDMDETDWLMSNPWLMDRLLKSREEAKMGRTVKFNSVEEVRRAVGMD